MQVVIMVIAVCTIVLFLLQAQQRKKTRYQRVMIKGKEAAVTVDGFDQWKTGDAQRYT
jgi:preprotein translocase subunit YajC